MTTNDLAMAAPYVDAAALLGVKVVVLLGAAGVVSRFALRRGPAALRHLVWALAFAGTFVLTVGALLPAELHAAAGAPSVSFTPVASFLDGSGVVLPATSAAPVPPAAPAPPPRLGLALVATAALACWALAAAFLLVRLVVGHARLGRRLARAVPVTDRAWLCLRDELAGHLRIRPPSLLVSTTADVPFAAGVLSPHVVLPAHARQWTSGRLRCVLLHELAHVARRDCAVQLLADVVCALHAGNPVVHLAARRLRAEREMAADDVVLSAGARASEYAGELMALAAVPRAGGVSRTRHGELSILGRGRLAERLTGLLDARRDRRPPSRRRGLGALAAALAVAVPLASVAGLAPDARAPIGAPLVLEADAVAWPAELDEAANVLRARLAAYGLAEASVTRTGHSIAVSLPPSADATAIEEDLLTGTGEVHLALVDAETSKRILEHPVLTAAARHTRAATIVPKEGDPSCPKRLRGARRHVAALLADASPALHLRVAAERDGDGFCPRVLDETGSVVLTPTTAQAGFRDGFATVEALAAEDAAAVTRLTSAHEGRQLAIVVDGLVWAAPVIRSPVGRHITVTLRGPASTARALAAAFVGKTLPFPLRRAGQRHESWLQIDMEPGLKGVKQNLDGARR